MPSPLFYRDLGNGHATVLLHGFAEDGSVWNQQAETLSADCRLIIPDLPGSGRSSSITPPTSIEDMATSVKVLLDTIGIEKCLLIGHSMGGYVGLAFAGLYPDRLSALGLFHSTAYPDNDDKKATRRKAIDFIRTNGASPFIRQSTPNLFSATTREQRPDLIATTIEKYSSFVPESLIAYYEAMIGRPDRTAVLKDFTCPVFFLMGEDDTVVPLQQALQQCYLPQISHMHIVKNAGHMAMLEAPEKSTQLLQDFINFVTRI